jgi:hypothetical protein
MYVGRHPNNTPVTPGDLLTVPKQIGEYYLMRTSDSIQDISDIKQFKSSMRNIRIFDEEQGRMVTIKYMDAVRNSFRFDNDGNLLTGNDPHGLFNKMDDDKNVSTDNTIISALDELEITRNREIPKFRWCDMTKENLTDESVKNVIQSIIIAMFKDPSEYMMTKDMYVDNKKNVTSFFNKLIKTCNGKKNLGENIKCLSTDIQARFDAFDVLLGTIWYNSEITFQNIESMHQMGIYIPLDFVIARPYMTYQVSTAIMLKSGKETGETSNIADRTLYGNYFYYGRAIVKNPKNVTLAPHVFIQNYLFGNNTKFMNEDDLRTINNYGAIREGRRNNSLLSIMVRANANVGYENIIDIRGENPSLPNTQKEGAFFPGFNFIKSKLNINIPTSSPAEIPDYENTDFTPNTICWAGHYESHDGKIIQLNTGHLGPNTYNGVQMTRTPGYYTAMKNVFSATAGRV